MQHFWFIFPSIEHDYLLDNKPCSFPHCKWLLDGMEMSCNCSHSIGEGEWASTEQLSLYLLPSYLMHTMNAVISSILKLKRPRAENYEFLPQSHLPQSLRQPEIYTMGLGSEPTQLCVWHHSLTLQVWSLPCCKWCGKDAHLRNPRFVITKRNAPGKKKPQRKFNSPHIITLKSKNQTKI
jgi:hypothetical protein